MTEIVWAQEAKIQYLKVLNFLFDEWGEQLAIDFEEKIIKFEELISCRVHKIPIFQNTWS